MRTGENHSRQKRRNTREKGKHKNSESLFVVSLHSWHSLKLVGLAHCRLAPGQQGKFVPDSGGVQQLHLSRRKGIEIERSRTRAVGLIQTEPN